MRRQRQLGTYSLISIAAITTLAGALGTATADVITINDGANPGLIDIPFTCSLGDDAELWLPTMGFVYRNVEAFTLIPGDTIAFDIQMRPADANDLGFRPQLDIALAHAPNPLMPFRPADLPGATDFTLVANDAIAASAGNRIAQDYELAFTVDAPFTFPGGGLIIRVSEPKGELALRNFMSCKSVITSDRQPSGTNRLVGTFFREVGEYPWLAENTTTDPFVPYVRINATRCGDGRITGVEACDDGNADDTDDCSNACRVAACGDGIVQLKEQCDNSADPGNVDPYCNDQCLLGAVAKGSGCDAGAGTGVAAILMLLGLMLRWRSGRSGRTARAAAAGTAAGAVLLALAWPSAASAQRTDGFRVDRFEMAPTVEDGLVIQDPGVLAHKVWSVSATLGFTNTILRVVPTADSDEGIDVVGSRLSAYLDFAIGIRDRFELNVSMPFSVVQDTESGMAAGYTLEDAGTSAIGDGRIGGSVRLYGRRTGPQLGLAATVSLPIGSERSFMGDGGVGGELQAMASLLKPRYRIIFNGGVRLRPEADYVSSDQGTELIGRAGVIVPFAEDRLDTSLELDVIGRVAGDDAYRELGSPVLALLGARYHFDGGMRAGAGIGMGLTEAPGSPAVRALLTVGYSPDPEPPAKPRPPTPPQPPQPLDTDRDGILDGDDACPTVAEDLDGVEDEDGCPEPTPEPAKTPEPPLTLEQVITLPAPIEFEYDTAIMLPGADVYLTQVLGVLKQNPDVLKLEIQGHTSSEGGAEYNLRLSNDRATAVFNWLVSRGVEAKRLAPRGYGLTQPLMPNDSEPNRQRNRRVQFRLVERQVPATTAPATPATPAATAPATPAATAPATPAVVPAKPAATTPAATTPTKPAATAPAATTAPAKPAAPAAPAPAKPATAAPAKAQ